MTCDFDPFDYLDYDQNTGEFRWKVGRRAGRVAGCVNQTLQGSQYRFIKINRKQYYAHRLAWRMTTGAWPLHVIDHINGDGLDNRLVNLREATVSQNGQNRKLNVNNGTGCAGVSWNTRKGMFKVDIQTNGKRKFVGYFESHDDAVSAANSARLAGHGEFARFTS